MPRYLSPMMTAVEFTGDNLDEILEALPPETIFTLPNGFLFDVEDGVLTVRYDAGGLLTLEPGDFLAWTSAGGITIVPAYEIGARYYLMDEPPVAT